MDFSAWNYQSTFQVRTITNIQGTWYFPITKVRFGHLKVGNRKECNNFFHSNCIFGNKAMYRQNLALVSE